MRQDVKVLLGRIGDETFNYHDFETPSLEVNIWPMFEALLLDERVVGKVDNRVFARAAPVPSELDQPVSMDSAPQTRATPTRPPRHEGATGGIFGNYGIRPAEPSTESVRSVLARLASTAG